MSDANLGPFRRDGRMHFAAEVRYDEAAQRAIRVATTLRFPGYILVLSLGPVAIVAATQNWLLLVASALLFFMAGVGYRYYSVDDAYFASLAPRRAWVTEDGIFLLDGELGPVRRIPLPSPRLERCE